MSRKVRKRVHGAGGGTRTPTLLTVADFESAASTDSATPAAGSQFIRAPGMPDRHARVRLLGSEIEMCGPRVEGAALVPVCRRAPRIRNRMASSRQFAAGVQC